MKNICIAIACLASIVSCEATPVTIGKDPSGVGGNSSSSSVSSSSGSSTSSSSSSSSGQGSGGSGSGLSCDPCENVDGIRLVRQYKTISSLDGAKVVSDFGFWDTLRNEACAINIDENGIERCFPAATATGTSQFADANCTIPVVAAPDQTCSGSIPKYAGGLSVDIADCYKTFYTLFSVGATVNGTIFQKSVMGCEVATPLPNFQYFKIGTKISPSVFAEIKTEYVH